MATSTFPKINFSQIKSESRRSSWDAHEKCGSTRPTLHEVRVTNLKKELTLTKDLMKDHMVEWGKNGCSIRSDGWTDRK